MMKTRALNLTWSNIFVPLRSPTLLLAGQLRDAQRTRQSVLSRAIISRLNVQKEHC
jgi:hypothetical protein